jgi:hypothetical protein
MLTSLHPDILKLVMRFLPGKELYSCALSCRYMLEGAKPFIAPMVRRIAVSKVVRCCNAGNTGMTLLLRLEKHGHLPAPRVVRLQQYKRHTTLTEGKDRRPISTYMLDNMLDIVWKKVELHVHVTSHCLRTDLTLLAFQRFVKLLKHTSPVECLVVCPAAFTVSESGTWHNKSAGVAFQALTLADGSAKLLTK